MQSLAFDLSEFCHIVLLHCVDNVCQGNVWICMELMDIPLHHFYKKVHETRGSFKEHEDVLRVIAFSVRCVLVCFLFTALQVRKIVCP